jgi:hypothetical protein
MSSADLGGNMSLDYLQYAGFVLAAASLSISGLVPRFGEFTIRHEDFCRRARLVVSVCRSVRQESLRRGIAEVLAEPARAVTPEGDLAAHARTDSQVHMTEWHVERLVRCERAARLVIVIDVVVAVVLAAASLISPGLWQVWAVAAGMTLAAMIGAYVWLFYLCNRLERYEEASREYSVSQ